MIKKIIHAIRTFLRGLILRCPHCGQGSMFQSHWTARKTCPNCNITFQPYVGDMTGVYAVAYFLSVIPAIIITILVGYYGQTGPWVWLGTFTVASSTIFFGLFPQFKALWICMVYLATGLRKNL